MLKKYKKYIALFCVIACLCLCTACSSTTAASTTTSSSETAQPQSAEAQAGAGVIAPNTPRTNHYTATESEKIIIDNAHIAWRTAEEYGRIALQQAAEAQAQAALAAAQAQAASVGEEYTDTNADTGTNTTDQSYITGESENS